MVALIKGAGDLASGIAVRLYRAGFKVVMTDIKVPTAVRRTVSFSRAVYESTAEIEGITGVLCKSSNEINYALQSNKISVIADEKCEILNILMPDALIDAIIAKSNTGTKISDAPCVIGVGPGFTAGADCHACVETQRGHTLGRVLYTGSPAKNTGVPGAVNGYTTERIIRSEAEGVFTPLCNIGDMVSAGQSIAESGGIIIKAQISGMVRGLLQGGVYVKPGMKCGDIDPRCVLSHCHTVSDKALAVGGGVLEAVLHFTAALK